MEDSAPALGDEEIRKLVADLYGLGIGTIKQLIGYDDKNYKLTDLTITDNSHIKPAQLLHGVTLKLTNPFETNIKDLSGNW